MALHSLANVTPNGATVPLASSSTPANWVQVIASGSGLVVGGSTTDATHGAALADGGGFMLPPAGNTNQYDLAKIYAYAPGGSAKLTVCYFTN